MSTKKLSKKALTKGFQIQSKYNRYFSDDFKRQKVKELESKRITIRQLCDIYKVSRTSVYKWLYKYSSTHQRGEKTVLQMDSEMLKTQQLLNRQAELERVIGQKQLQIDLLEKTLELASEELGYDIKKKYGQKSSNTSVNIAKN